MNEATVNVLKLLLAAAGAGLLAWGLRLARRGDDRAHRGLRDGLLLMLGGAAALGYANFGRLHFSNFIHTWDTYHYYLGSKYFPELGYDRLYECTATADSESGLRAWVAKRRITDLLTNHRVSTEEILSHPERCKAHFTAERWRAFVDDVTFFRGRVTPARWAEMQYDHGYNATPVWNIAGHALSNLGPATVAQVTALNLIDPLLLLAMAALIGWAFGARTLAVALLAFGTGYANRFFWTGGAFLRHDWLFYSVAAVCLLKKERPFLAGLCLSYATALRLFPGLLAVGPFLLWALTLRRTRRLDPALTRFLGAALLGGALCAGAGLVFSGGVESYARFFQNTSKHAATPLTNHMGLRTLLSYRPSAVSSVLRDRRAVDPWGAWKDARLRHFEQLKALYLALMLAAGVGLFFAVRPQGTTPWVACALSACLIGGLELTCYYYAFVILPALLYERRREVGVLLLAFAAATQFLAFAPLPGMSQIDDEKYVAMSGCALVAFAAILWLFTQRGRQRELAAEPALAFAPPPAMAAKERRRARRP